MRKDYSKRYGDLKLAGLAASGILLAAREG
jgi:hypothetical protein